MKLLVIGSNGQLGWELGKKGKEQGHATIGVDLPDFNITDQTQVVQKVEQVKPQLVVNASAYTAVDKAESEPEIAYAVNEKGPRHLAKICATHDIPMIHISTDYVFNGKKQTPYVETDPVDPTGVYGKSKASGEDAVREALASHIIIRTAWLYGTHGNNFVKTMIRLGKERESIQVVADQYGCPTYAADLADAILSIARQLSKGVNDKWGTYHFCGSGSTTWHGFAEEIFEVSKDKIPLMVRKAEPISTEDYPTPAQRPANSILNCRKIEQTFGITPQPWERSLQQMLVKWLGSENMSQI